MSIGRIDNDIINYKYVLEKLNGAIDQVRNVDKKYKVEIMKRVYGGHLEVIFGLMEGAIIRGSRGHRGVGMDIMDKDMTMDKDRIQKSSMVGEFSVDDYGKFIDCIVNRLKDFYMKCVTWEEGKIEVKSINEIKTIKDVVLKDCRGNCIEAFDMEKKVDELIKYDLYYVKDKNGNKIKTANMIYANMFKEIDNRTVFVNSMKIIENDGLEKDDPKKDKRHIDTFDKKLQLLLILCIIKKVENKKVDAEVSVLQKYHERIGVVSGNIYSVTGIGSIGDKDSLITFINKKNKKIVVEKLLREDIAGVKWSSLR